MNRHTENKPRQREPPEPDDYSRQPLTACDCVAGGGLSSPIVHLEQYGIFMGGASQDTIV